MKRQGPFIGIVTNNVDPEALGRVQIKLPMLGERELPWARVMAPRAGSSQGFYFRPGVGDEVVVEFLEGDPNQPLVLGALWNAGNPPPTALVGQSVIRTRSGHSIVFDDAHGAEVIEISTASGQSILLTDETDGSRIEFSNGTSDARIILDGDGQITIAADSGDITISAGQGDVALKGVNIRLDALASVDITGQAGVVVESQGVTQVKSSLVQLDGATVFVNGKPIT